MRARAQKPGFFQIFRFSAPIRQKTRFLRVAVLKSSTGARNRVFSRYFVSARRFRQKPGFSESQCLNPVQGPETGFFRDISFQPADSAKNPVSQSRSA
ncbi:MAG: hypothetical protein EAZ60_16510 [Oscillatoriales cyanobacterium]|nr:MAG: hypothetical protein EAZ83_05165 [Oscillatoriales cyanobacterium]TAF22727.1 MAG: hypothetical protein EAZ73_03965 [Oscillatoriales cyanobacterium]TAF36251.1 MAG: hypothetical protein EAZ69_11055 [Oscillatoriales cyanobacterium]TAF54482.1 MAG: hypothetical protein EAZ60_16510 [Oscillatoriales cyanobacterium]